MRPLILALQFMTRLPQPSVPADGRDMAAAIRWFPVAGLLVGACVAGGAWLGLQRDPWAGALLALLAWVGMTGALHLDGLGDIADAAGAGHADASRISKVLADPHIGSFGVTAIVLQLLSKLVLLRLVIETTSLTALVAVPMIARAAPLSWARTLPPLHAGLGTKFRAGASVTALAGWWLAIVMVALALAPALLAALPGMVLWRWWLLRRIGGISGDGHGAGIELVETVTLAALVFVP
jgi:adenosylcobinamide-GDP ribazoletransferase